MRYILFVFMLLFSASSYSANVNFSWADTVNGSNTSYNLYCDGTQIATGIIGLTYTHDFQMGISYSCYVTATLDGLESDPSNIVAVRLPNAPENLNRRRGG